MEMKIIKVIAYSCLAPSGEAYGHQGAAGSQQLFDGLETDILPEKIKCDYLTSTNLATCNENCLEGGAVGSVNSFSFELRTYIFPSPPIVAVLG